MNDAPVQDGEFAAEQAHLDETYDKLEAMARRLADRIEANLQEARAYKSDMDGQLTCDFADDSASIETLAEYAVMNNVVEGFNISVDMDAETLRRVSLLLQKPYFAKVTLQFPGRPGPRDIYLGSAGATDDRRRPIVVDWRSPVAETYYSQKSGPMTYEANGRTVQVDLKARRQYEIEGRRLLSFFDTTVAIQDPMLLASLSQHRSAKLQAITATIQAEQNEVIRHADVPTLLVRGVAGSGKTSVMLQRIAYLLYQDRASLSADRVWLITPNRVFERYIWDVLPQLGEKNPRALTFAQLVDRLGATDRGLGANVEPQVLARIDAEAPQLAVEREDMRPIDVGTHHLLTVQQIWKSVQHWRAKAAWPRAAVLVEEDLREKLERRIEQLAHEDAVHDELLALDDNDRAAILGDIADPLTEEEFVERARTYLDCICQPAFEAIEDGAWLHLDRVGMRLLGKADLSATEYLYLKMALTGHVDTDARFVMVDEVQDYTEAQLMVLVRYFSRAHFLLLGDPNQAIREGTVPFGRIRDVFARAGEVDECRLLTSYRSSPEITALFASLLPDEERFAVSSVQPPGLAPEVLTCDDADALVAEVARRIRDMREEEGLGAVVVGNRRRAVWLGKALAALMGDEAPAPLSDGSELPDEGVVLLDLGLAKGLEFDRIVIADATPDEYGDDPLGRRRLYTAISRATKQVCILAQGRMTPLLAGKAADAQGTDAAGAAGARGAAADQATGKQAGAAPATAQAADLQTADAPATAPAQPAGAPTEEAE